MAKRYEQDARASAKATSSQAQQELAPVVEGQQREQAASQRRADVDYDKANYGLDVASESLKKASGTYDMAKPGYQAFAETGGFTPGDENRYLNRATSGVTNTGTALMQRANLNRSKTGGGGTGGEVAQIARQLGQRQMDATAGAQVDLNTMKNANKFAGLKGTTDIAAGEGMIGSRQSEVAQAHSALFDRNTGQVSELGRQMLYALGLKYNTEMEANQILMKMAGTPGIMDNIQRIGGMVGGAITGTMGGFRAGA